MSATTEKSTQLDDVNGMKVDKKPCTHEYMGDVVSDGQ